MNEKGQPSKPRYNGGTRRKTGLVTTTSGSSDSSVTKRMKMSDYVVASGPKGSFIGIPDEMTTRQVGALIGFSPTAVIEWTKKGLLPVRVTPGGHRRYKLADVQAFSMKLQRGEFKAPGLPVEQKLAKILRKPGIKKGK